MKKQLLYLSLLPIVFIQILVSCKSEPQVSNEAPNIIFIFADDWSFPHAGVYGDTVVKTPNFDRIAREGILFEHAYVSSPSCTPSRAAVLSGQHFWRLEEGANLYGPLPPKFPVYTDALESAGYHVGFIGKGWAPGDHPGRLRNPAGDKFENFHAFLQKREKNKPLCFWRGSPNPHRGYKKGSGEASGIDLSKIQLPAPFPESEMIRKDVADYYKEVQDFDTEIGEILTALEEIGELDNSLIVVSSDNGMPFPRCKSNVYDMGTRVPLAIRWGKQIKASGSRIQEFVSLTDLAPTFLEAAQVDIPDQMTGKSLLSLLKEGKADAADHRSEIFFGKERHVPGQELGDWGGYPSRAIRTQEYLYIKNFRPDRWPAGTPDYEKATFYPAFYSDVDGGPTRTYMLSEKDKDAKHQMLYSLAFEKRPEEEFFDLKNDPDQLHNVADDPQYASKKQELAKRLLEELTHTGDPRIKGNPEIFETYPYTGGTPFPDDFKRQSRIYATQKIDNFPSNNISSRSIEILTPINIQYDQRYPVLYMFDGQNIFHEFEGWGGENNKGWRVDEVLDSLNQAGTVPPVIVVGIFNSEKRMAEYMPAKPKDLLRKRIAETTEDWYKSFKNDPPDSDAQLKFIVEELKPYIDGHFKTKKDWANTFIAGSSMGGLISAYAICEYPEVFGGAACFSTHWPPLDGVFLEYFKENLPDPATHKFYFDHGTVELDAEYEPFQKIADGAMKARGFVKGENWITRKYEGARHYEDNWHARFHVPMEFLLGGGE